MVRRTADKGLLINVCYWVFGVLPGVVHALLLLYGLYQTAEAIKGKRNIVGIAGSRWWQRK